jgi:hypothetical protein
VHRLRLGRLMDQPALLRAAEAVSISRDVNRWAYLYTGT